jgi:hypothetical protein
MCTYLPNPFVSSGSYSIYEDIQCILHAAMEHADTWRQANCAAWYGGCSSLTFLGRLCSLPFPVFPNRNFTQSPVTHVSLWGIRWPMFQRRNRKTLTPLIPVYWCVQRYGNGSLKEQRGRDIPSPSSRMMKLFKVLINLRRR